MLEDTHLFLDSDFFEIFLEPFLIGTVQSVFFLSGWGRVGLDAAPVARVAKRRTHPGSICLVRRFEPYQRLLATDH